MTRDDGFRTPDWALWNSSTTATLRDCVALSVGVNPNDITEHFWETLSEYGLLADQRITEGWGGPPTPFDATLATVWKRMNASKGAVSATGPLKPDTTVIYTDVATARLPLRDFMEWARLQGWQTPSEIALPPKNPEPRNSSAATGASWKDMAREYADEFWRRDVAIGNRPSKHEIAKNVEERFEDYDIRGPRRRKLMAENILRNALTDWSKPKQTKTR